MTKETITYTDLNGVQRTEDFYFDLSKPEIVKMQARTLLRPLMVRRAMMADAS